MSANNVDHSFMIHNIKKHIHNGGRVFWASRAYEVFETSEGYFNIVCSVNGSCIGLHGRDGGPYENRLNGEIEDFYFIDGSK